MIVKIHILGELRKLNSLYTHASQQGKNQECDFYSKLAFLELCGWTEESIDDLVLSCIKRKKINIVKSEFEKRIGYVYGFEYEKHFRSILFNAIGAIGLEKIERKIDKKLQTMLGSALDELWKKRGLHAHASLRRSAQYLDAPSVTIARFWDIYNGLAEYQKKLIVCGY